MKFEEFEKYQKELLDKVVEMGSTKGREYANGEDRFGNFNRLAARLGISNIQVALVYCTKHLDSLESYMKSGRVYSDERIEGRIVDIITYMTLIAGMIRDSEITSAPNLESYRQAMKDLTNRQESKEDKWPKTYRNITGRDCKPARCKYCNENATVYNSHMLEATCDKHETKVAFDPL